MGGACNPTLFRGPVNEKHVICLNHRTPKLFKGVNINLLVHTLLLKSPEYISKGGLILLLRETPFDQKENNERGAIAISSSASLSPSNHSILYRPLFFLAPLSFRPSFFSTTHPRCCSLQAPPGISLPPPSLPSLAFATDGRLG